ncbi:hypothetical protein BT96DRAFT_978668 [Gymnopus androsaceus JB14]|uniref:Uncharacterized protein n=1 Tax=Gymnopus androsaceus JB14 TaxID=1447944 RepID=A0A6A4H7R9_9AGAR|nr:hypothetical protein BT96DRAFT_978668 [Gymnopus androsaceus JB14]
MADLEQVIFFVFRLCKALHKRLQVPPKPKNGSTPKLAGSFGRMNRALMQTSNLCELLQMDLRAMQNFVGIDASLFMTVAASFNDESDEDHSGDEMLVENSTDTKKT